MTETSISGVQCMYNRSIDNDGFTFQLRPLQLQTREVRHGGPEVRGYSLAMSIEAPNMSVALVSRSRRQSSDHHTGFTWHRHSSKTMAAVVRRGRSRSSSPPRLRVLLLLLALVALVLQPGVHAALWSTSSSSPDSTTKAATSSMQMEPVHLDWENIDCVLTLKDGRRKHLLKGVS